MNRYTPIKSKYGSKKVTVDGITFDSKREARRYVDLKAYERLGRINNLRLQVPFELIPAQHEPSGEYYKRGAKAGQPKMLLAERKCEYIADFVYEKDGKTIVEDTKGMRTADYIIKRKLMLWIHGIKIKEV